MTPNKKPISKLRLFATISTIWIFFTALFFITNITTNKELDFGYTLLWHSGWLVWIPLTYILFSLSPRLTAQWSPSGFPIMLHVFLAFGFAAIHLIIEFTCNIPIRLLIFKEGVGFNHQLVFGSLFSSKIIPNLVFYSAIVGVAHAYNYFIKYQDAEENVSKLNDLLAKNKLQVLTMQLQPHFLFNTHNSIISLMIKNETESAIKMLTQLSELLRITLEKNQEQFSSLKEELTIVELYLNIQKERFQERLTVEIEFDPELENCELPSLSLQPLIENSIIHGISPKVEGGKIVVSCRKYYNSITLKIEDDGIGFDSSKVKSTGGIGLKTTRARLEQLYGKHHSFFSIEPRKNGGTEVIISIPYKVYQRNNTANEVL